MRTVFRVFLGFIAAILAAAVTEVLFAQPPTGWAGTEGISFVSQILALGDLTLKAATHTAIFSALFALIVIVIGEWLKLRTWLYYAAAGVVIGFSGFLAQYSAEQASLPTIVNGYALAAFVTAGAVGGWFYWATAGRNAGRKRKPAKSTAYKWVRTGGTTGDNDGGSSSAKSSVAGSAKAAAPGYVPGEIKKPESSKTDTSADAMTNEANRDAVAQPSGSVLMDGNSGPSRIYVPARTVPDSGKEKTAKS
ncbi:MAG: hypothetical protein ACK5KM_05225 [Hyphomicrobiaceae bacterium]